MQTIGPNYWIWFTLVVSDTSDDVRRGAITSLASLLSKNPGQVPRIVQLLSESYNPHVRCGATLALGIACTRPVTTAAPP
jgi:26S proteasome regulatory subunit N2